MSPSQRATNEVEPNKQKKSKQLRISFASGDADGSLALKRQKIVADVSSEASGSCSIQQLGVWLVSSLGPNAAELSVQQLTISSIQQLDVSVSSIQQLGVSLVGGSAHCGAQRSIQQLLLSHVIIQQLGHHCHSARDDSGTGQRWL